MNLLTDKFRELCTAFPNIQQANVKRDTYGVYAIAFRRTNDKGRQATAFFCVKSSMTAGHLVSIHKELFDEARKGKYAVIIAIGEVFYQFTPSTIKEKQYTENKRYGVTMINFSIEHGTRIKLPIRNDVDLFTNPTVNHPVVQELNKQFNTVIV